MSAEAINIKTPDNKRNRKNPGQRQHIWQHDKTLITAQLTYSTKIYQLKLNVHDFSYRLVYICHVIAILPMDIVEDIRFYRLTVVRISFRRRQ